MNRIYRSIWSEKARNFVAVSEISKSAGKKATSCTNGVSTSLHFTLKTIVVSLLMAFGGVVYALPVGGVVSAGSATISSGVSQTTINQTTQNAAINWQAFNIGTGQTVQFVQPNSSSVTLNRVLGSDPSSILGNLSANGNVFLVNPNGILFGKGAQVNVGGLVASTLNISNTDFMAGNYIFSGTGGTILNQGSIHADGGYVALLGANISNEGVISARLGTVALAAGNAITLDVAGDGLLNVTVNQGALNTLVQNGGLIQADGGQVLLTAREAGNLLQSAVNNTGVIQAQTIENHNGTIKLLGDMQIGTVNVGGTLDASAPKGGNGGFIETSAATVKIANDAKITTAAPNGKIGTWLIDPVNFTIAENGGDIAGTTLSSMLVTNNVTISTVETGTNTATNLYAAPGQGDINVNSSIGGGAPLWSATPNTTTLTLNAFRDVNINASIVATNGNVVACCGRDVNVNAPITTTNGSVLLAAGNNVNVAAAMTTTNGNITLCAGNDVNVTQKITLTNSGSIASQSLGLAPGLVLSAGNNATGPGTGGSVYLPTGALRPTITQSEAPVTDVAIYYNPSSYTAPIDYFPQLILVGGINLTQQMLVFPSGANKTYDGTTAANFTSLQGNLTGVALVSGPGSSATFDTAAVGTNKIVTFSGYTLTGVDAGNYALPVACCGAAVGTGTTTANITPAVVVPPVTGEEGGPTVFPPYAVLPTSTILPQIALLIEAPPELQTLVPPVVVPPVAVPPTEYVAPQYIQKQDRN